jgi:hypothetical protein
MGVYPDSRELIAPEDARRAREAARSRADADASPGPLAEAEKWVGEHPQIAMGAALAIGLALGWWVKR